ncbi:MAG TPA: malto-oligosyltrehalose synthase [Casimicrobiaceae bacterium]|nr:malto-oligosyltrehalose synthase [Casimicrobiaceae bacterium]
MSEALARLAAAHAIAQDYHDVWGHQHRVPDATLRALLAAMGVHAPDEPAAVAALCALDDAVDAPRIAPLVVLRENVRPWTLRVRLPITLADAPLGVRVIAEDGAQPGDAMVSVLHRDRPTRKGAACVGVELALAASLPPGYHQVELLAGNEVVARTCCAVAPPACYVPVPPQEGRTWGAAVQLYGVRSARNWGIGDFTDLATLVEQWGARGAGIVGVNPLHALFPHEPRRASPYSPSSRLFRNDLYVDVEAVAEFRECDEARALVLSAPFQASLAALRDAPQVDYAGVAAAKRPVLELLYRHFLEHHLAAGDARAEAFRAYVVAAGEALTRHSLFEALQEHFHRDDAAVWGWPAWPEPYRDPQATAVARFATDNADRVEYYAYVEWQAEQQFAAVGARARAAGLSVGVFADLALSVDRGGAEVWAHQDLYALGASVGAPPDTFNMKGQDWGLPPMIPDRLRDAGYAPFLATLRANMRHAGALRIDHVMGLARLFWVPAGSQPANGAYVRYPFEELLGLLALESHRHRCLVIGEDLGTVPDYVREALAANAILSYRVLIFEREATGDFKPPAAYPAEALVAASTHDLPTLAGWWTDADIELRAAQGLLASEADREAQTRDRAQDRRRLLAALERAQLLPPETGTDPASHPDLDPTLARAVQTYLAVTPSRLHVVQLEDVIGVREQANLPGTIDSHPNWRRKLPVPLERWPDDERFDALATALERERRRPRKRRASPGRATPLHVPLATYRVQLNGGFTFADATALVPYLAALGVSHVYCSPYLRARPGSLHGYDIVDHSALNPEIGSREDFERFVAALDAHGMGHLCDMVPNHVGVMGADNAWWMDVLENGPASACAEFFDIDWSPFDADLAGRVLVPVLGDPYGVVLERGELGLAFEPETGAFAVRYFGHRFPIDPREYPILLAPALELGRGDLSPEGADAIARLVAALRALPPRTVTAADALAVRRRDSAACKSELAQLAVRHRALADAIARLVADVNGVPGRPESFERLHALLEAQAYRLAYWRVASDEINYRRFFDVHDLAALRMENQAVFDATHAFILQLAAAGKIHGLRIDHPDGLYDPARYFEQLQARYQQCVAETGASTGGTTPPAYVVLEKIGASHERMPERWPISGTTGYRFATVVNGLFVAGVAKARLDRAWRAFVGTEALDYEATVYRSKHATMRGPLAAELTMVTHRALRVARGDRRTRDFTFNALRRAIEEIVAHFPVYRTYVAEGGASAQDRRYIDWAVARARRESRAADASVFDFLRAMMLASPPPGATAERKAQYLGFAMRFQQFTAPVAAKGVEDTSFYTFNRFVALNDVGGDPDQFGTTVRAFHGASQDRAAVWPATMLATSTHDNKRSEDVRARIDVISELPAEWRLTVRRWSRLNRSRKRQVDGRDAPSRNDEYLLYQTLVGTFPAGQTDVAALAHYCERIQRYMVKAAREAKVRTSWLGVNADYEDALVSFVAALLAAEGENLFLDDLRAQSVPFAWFGMLNSLSMALIKFASPGVPDLYQGNELFDLRLVDPDNRVAVDYDVRRARLAELVSLAGGATAVLADAIPSWFATPGDGRAKLWITFRLLRFREAHREILATGDYLPVRATGQRADHVVAFARRHADAGAIAVAGRLFASLGLAPGALPQGEAAWGDTALDIGFLPPDTTVTNVLTGEALIVRDGRVPMALAFRQFPGALLHYAPGG